MSKSRHISQSKDKDEESGQLSARMEPEQDVNAVINPQGVIEYDQHDESPVRHEKDYRKSSGYADRANLDTR